MMLVLKKYIASRV